MRHVNWMMILMIAFGVRSYAQAQRQNDSIQQVDQSQGVDTDAIRSEADTPGSAAAASGANSTNPGAASDERAVNAAAVPETTTSGSGSPAVLSREDGKIRDGTNNVQRASPNMVGSPARKLGLEQIRTEDANTEMKDRQDYTQDKARSARAQAGETSGSSSRRESGDINDKSRRENNKRSDQNLSAKEKNTSAEREKRDQKSEGKSKKKRQRG